MKKTSNIFLPVIVLLAYLLCIPAFGTANHVSVKGSEQHSSSVLQKHKVTRLADLPAQAREKISQHLRKAEYEVSRCERTMLSGNTSAYRAFNRNQNLSAYFTNQGVHFLPKGKGKPAWHLEMTFSAYGYDGAMQLAQPLRSDSIKASANRVEYRRGVLTEWYVNDEQGLEQGVTLRKAPAGKGSGPLVFEWAVAGFLVPRMEQQGAAILFCKEANAPVLRYTGLYAFDADGKTLPARLTLAGDNLRILVDDSAARYPITIDPWIQRAKLTASDGAFNDQFGASVAISGDTVVVGARYDEDNGSLSGSAYVFEKPVGGWANMTETAKLTASDGAAHDVFGYSVAIRGDTVVIGVYGHNGYKGSAYVFEKPGGGWANMTETAKLTASDGAASDVLGYSVAIRGDTVVAGASGDTYNGFKSGSAYVFEKPVGGWANMTETAKLTASDGAAYDHFAWSVAVSGDTVVVGARGDEDYSDTSGFAYIFEKPGGGWSGLLTETAKLSASDGAEDDYFGASVAISGDTVMVGAPRADITNGVTFYDVGRAYVFDKPVGGWANMTQTAKLTASDGAAIDYFGDSMAISGDTIVIGAWGGDGYKGSAYVFDKPVGGWFDMTETAKLSASDGTAYDDFGYSVAISLDTVVIGAHQDDDNGVGSGSAYVFVAIDLCECDLNHDGSCDGLDWFLFIEDWGSTNCNDPGVECECDLNNDGSCDGLDWYLFIEDWGRTDCP